ncbi:MAG: glycosyltransferase family 2 protein [Candidatus Omnitrophica bacterium]|nr:glycosyltransferase family 2 protein [Candidatus Omnitrophota bacterium]
MTSSPAKKRIGIMVVAYNAINTLASTINRIPQDVMSKIEEVFVLDDNSHDLTYETALEYKKVKSLDKLQIFRNEKNLKYGGNQKKGYRYAIDKGLDIVALLHGDGQYAPEIINTLLEPIEKGEADLVMGSRMTKAHNPIHGGMPLYKFFGNKILTFLENKALNMSLSEFHSGYRVYNCHALKKVPFEKCSNDWHFDTDIIIQFKEKGLSVLERPIPTYYGNEICYVNGIAYAFHCLESVVKYRLHKAGLVNIAKFKINEQ